MFGWATGKGMERQKAWQSIAGQIGQLFVCVSLCGSVAKINLLQRKTFLLSEEPTRKIFKGSPLCSPCLSGETSLCLAVKTQKGTGEGMNHSSSYHLRNLKLPWDICDFT